MSWLSIILLAYFFLGLSYFGDKLVLAGKPKAKLYVFYVGCLNIFLVLLIPFVKLGLPNAGAFPWILLEPAAFLGGLYTMFLSLQKMEVSREITIMGAVQPIFVLILSSFIWGGTVMSPINIVAFVLMLLGGVIISVQWKTKKRVSFKYVLLVILSAFLFSLDYIFSKLFFFHEPFLPGFIWIRLLSCLYVVIFFLLDKKLRAQVFAKTTTHEKKNNLVFLVSQGSGAASNVLQSFAISLAPVSYLAIMNALSGVQYVFLFAITVFFSYFFPKILKEDISKEAIAQKVVAIVLIGAGLALLVVS
jgi:drug/metabolite transporter (DMT)-like permease